MASPKLKHNIEASSSSSSSSPNDISSSSCSGHGGGGGKEHYDVFISFRGEDTRTNFVSHLYNALFRSGVNAYKDDPDLPKGKSISPQLLQAIQASKSFIVVFSPNYASSTWCMDELLHILRRCCDDEVEVYPVFYGGLDPSHVRKQTGSFGEAMERHERNMGKHRVALWRMALTKAASFAGWDSRHATDEANLIEEIVTNIRNKLSRTASFRAQGLVGMDSRLSQMESMLDIRFNDVRIVGIWGMGGSGKTTIAKAVYGRITSHFDGCCFLESVREISGRHGLGHLQEEILNKVLMDGNMKKKTLFTGLDSLKDRLHYKKVLIVLDDVDHLQQLRTLAGERDWFGPGSRIIVTTRDKHLLVSHGVDHIYEARELSYFDSVKLFSQYAFRETPPMDELVTLRHRAVNYAKGLPLALKVLGSFLCDKSVEEWENELDKLQRIPSSEVQSVLRVSFDGLDDLQKNIFLDIACFFKGEDKEYVKKILEASGFFPYINLRVLIDKSLITIVDDRLWMHDLLQEMGREIVRQECYREPGKRSRLWNQEDAFNVLTKNTGTEEVEGLVLDLGKINEAHVNAKVFCRMSKLRVLKIWYAHLSGGFEYDLRTHSRPDISTPRRINAPAQLRTTGVHFVGELKYLSNDLRCLIWHGYPFISLPSNFNPQNLVEFDASSSQLVKFWTEMKVFDKLKFMKLSHSQKLIKTPDFTGMPNLETLILEGCINLVTVHRSAGFLKSLTLLNLRGCKNLLNFPAAIGMESLKVLILAGCSKLDKFPEIQESMNHLKELLLDDTAIRELPESIKLLPSVVLLSAKGCKQLTSLPSSICGLSSLKILDLSGCSKLHSLPGSLMSLQNLEELQLAGTAVTEPPMAVGTLERLRLLSFHGCKRPPKTVFQRYLLQRRSFSGPLILLERILHWNLYHLTSLDLSYCNFTFLPSHTFQKLVSLKHLDLSGNNFKVLGIDLLSFKNLEVLHLANCKKLIALPELPSTIYSVGAPNCTSLCNIEYPSEVQGLRMRGFTFINCFKLSKVTDYSTTLLGENLAVRMLKSHVMKTPVHLFAEFSLIFPANGIEEWLFYERIGSLVTFDLPNHWYHNTFKGLSLWAIFAVDDALPADKHELSLEFCLRCNGQNLISDTGFTLNWDRNCMLDGQISYPNLMFNKGYKVKENHLWIRFFPSLSFKMTRTTDEYSRIDVTLKSNSQGLAVKKCGLYPMCWDEKTTKFMDIGESTREYPQCIDNRSVNPEL